jgi:hypothetical protein
MIIYIFLSLLFSFTHSELFAPNLQPTSVQSSTGNVDQSNLQENLKVVQQKKQAMLGNSSIPKKIRGLLADNADLIIKVKQALITFIDANNNLPIAVQELEQAKTEYALAARAYFPLKNITLVNSIANNPSVSNGQDAKNQIVATYNAANAKLDSAFKKFSNALTNFNTAYSDYTKARVNKTRNEPDFEAQIQNIEIDNAVKKAISDYVQSLPPCKEDKWDGHFGPF